MVYSINDALEIARAQSDRHVVFFAIGFETTTPPTAVVLRQAQREKLGNFSVYCNHVLTPPALRALLATDLPPPFQEAATCGTGLVDGFIGPAHVSTIIGTRAYEFVATEYRRPLVIAGFEPLDVLQSILMLVRQINAGEAQVENEYTRAVGAEGNRKAQQWMDEVFEVRPSFEWRGLGELPNSALAIRPAFADWDADRRFAVPAIQASDPRPAPVARCCVASSARKSARCSPAPAPPIIHWVPAWSRPKARGTLSLWAIPAGGDRVSPDEKTYARKLDLARGCVEIGHGGGGRAMAQLIEELFLAAFDNDWLRQDDCARLTVPTGRLVMATDSHVVSPLFFPGGDIGCLSVHGTLNDVAMAGAAAVSGRRLHPGGRLPLADLQRIVTSMARAARDAEVPIVTGDTKVVERGKATGIHHHHRRRRDSGGRGHLRQPGATGRRGCCSAALWASTAWRCWRNGKT